MESEDRYQQPQKHIFILSGQSNMAGRGGVHHHKWDNVIPSECQPHPSILRFTSGSRWELAQDPLHADIDTAKVCGVGPGMSFANSLLSHHHPDPAVAVGLVPCAVGGTAIKEWGKGSRLYGEMVRRALEAVEKGGGWAIRAVLWYQGESDTEDRHAAESYRANMERFVRDVRCDLGLPELPFIQVALASGEKKWIETVRVAQLQIGTDVPNLACVDAKGLHLNEDQMHLTTGSQVVLGKMLAEAYIKHFLDPSCS